MVGRSAHVMAAALVHVDHFRHARRFHRTGLRRRLHSRHPAKGKREADQEEQIEPQIAFHAGQFRPCTMAEQLPRLNEVQQSDLSYERVAAVATWVGTRELGLFRIAAIAHGLVVDRPAV